MSAPSVPQSPVTVRRIPDPAEPVPRVSLPLLGLLATGVVGWIASTTAYLAGALPWWVTIPLNALCSYLLFTVAHDAGHSSASNEARTNRWMGRLAVPFFAPHASFPTWRFIHMQHHRFTNHDDGTDPDHYAIHGPRWQLPLRWATIDLYYMVFYLPHLRRRPRSEQVEQGLTLAAFAALIVASVATGHLVDLLVVLLIPCRLSVVFLGWAFDYLPHNGLHHTPKQDRLKATRNRVGGEGWLTPTMLFQNYHLVHHLHPRVPFHRYVAVWRRNEEAYLEGDPALSTVGGRPITADEYRRLRELAEHDHDHEHAH
jgi:ring-1,2-phenylacetyl-CoA epoxidase subunit PaaE